MDRGKIDCSELKVSGRQAMKRVCIHFSINCMIRVLHLYFKMEFFLSIITKYCQIKIKLKYSTCLLYVNRFTKWQSIVITLNQDMKKLSLSRKTVWRGKSEITNQFCLTTEPSILTTKPYHLRWWCLWEIRFV